MWTLTVLWRPVEQKSYKNLCVEKGLSSDYQVLHAGNGIDENDKDEFDSVLAEAMQAYLKITMETDGN